MNQPTISYPVYADILRDSLSRNARRDCFHIKRNAAWRTWTYDDFRRNLNAFSHALKKSGFGAGDKGVVIGENCPEWIIAYHGFFCAGGATVPIDPNLPAAEIREILRVTRASYVVCSATLLSVIEELRIEAPSLKKILVLYGNAPQNSVSFDEFSSRGSDRFDALAGPFSADDTTVILFTSGTTGKAKGVALTQKNFTSAPLHGIPKMKASGSDTMLAVLPLHHVFGAAACIAGALCTGIDLVFVTSMKAPLIMEAIRENHVTILPAVPKMVGLFYNAIERKVRSKGFLTAILFRALMLAAIVPGARGLRKKFFSSVHESFGGKLNLIISGGASLAKKYFNGFRRMGFTIVEGYGLTETFGPITLCPAAAPKLGSVGTILPGNDMKIVQPDANGAGEVLFRGACVFAGYYENKEQTRRVFDGEGWFHTGDIGFIDKQGYLFLSGRIKDVIILESGKNAYPDELEDFYSASTLIEEIGVFGVTIKGKEIIAALIVPSASVKKNYGMDKAGEVIRNEIVRMGRNLPSYKKLTDFAVVADLLPRTTTQKLKKHELRQMYIAKRDATGKIRAPARAMSAMDSVLAATEEFGVIRRHIADLVNAQVNRDIFPADNLELDLELDSMKRVELCAGVEESYAIQFPDEELFKLQTAGDLCRLVVELKSGAALTPEAGSIQTIRKRLAVASSADIALPEIGNRVLTDLPAAAAFSVSKALWGLTVTGAENLATEGPVIFCANHQSYIDILWLLYALPPQVRKMTFATGKSDVLASPLLSMFVKNTPFIPIEHGGDVLKALRLSIAALKQGRNLIIFPEGGRSRTGDIRPFKAGIGMLMIETNAAVVPVKIKGSFDIWAPGKLPKFITGRKNPPSVTFGQRFTLQDLIDKCVVSAYSTDQQVAQCIQNIVEAM